MANQAPTDRNLKFILCESAREEKGGRLTILGYTAAETLGLPTDFKFPAAFPIAFVFVATDGSGKFKIQVKLEDPTKKNIFSSALGEVDFKGKANAQITINFVNFTATEFGDYTITLALDDTKYVRTFKLIPDPAANILSTGG